MLFGVSGPLICCEKPLLQGGELKKLRLYSAPCGAGLATASLVSSGFYDPVGAVDYSDVAIDSYIHNFGTSGMTYFGDLTRKHPDYVPKADVCWLSPSCTDYSALGRKANGTTEGHGPHYARMVLASGARVLLIEQVCAYYKSPSYAHLKGLLSHFFPYWHETTMNAHDYGSVASRTRGYVMASMDPLDFKWPEAPAIPQHRRKTVGEVIGKDWEKDEWRKIEGTVMEGLLKKDGNNNFTAGKNPTLVGLEDTRIAAIVASYKKFQVTSSYLKHPEGELWRPFSSKELGSFLSVPDFYEFPEFLSESNKTKMLGQSVDCGIVKAIGIELAYSLFQKRYREHQKESTAFSSASAVCIPDVAEEEGQFAFRF